MSDVFNSKLNLQWYVNMKKYKNIMKRNCQLFEEKSMRLDE